MTTTLPHASSTPARLTGGPATIVYHCAIFGPHSQRVRAWEVGEVGRYAQYKRAVCVRFVEPRKRNWKAVVETPTNIRWITVETSDGQTLYDSRDDVPVDMAHWNESYKRHGAQA